MRGVFFLFRSFGGVEVLARSQHAADKDARQIGRIPDEAISKRSVAKVGQELQ
jgi:hypothetical protein